jgi:hypothetical protein
MKLLKEAFMLQEDDIIILVFCAICEALGEEDKRHPQGSLWLSEIVLLGVLWALKGGSFLQFHRWVSRRRFCALPERSRLSRLLKEKRGLCRKLLAKPTFFNVMDTYGIEIIRPIREGRSKQSQAVSAKGKSGHRWIVGRKVCIRINDEGGITAYDDDTANVHDQTFNHLAEDDAAITLTDAGFKNKKGMPETLKICPRGSWNERMAVETLFSLWERVCKAKTYFVRSVIAFKARIDYLVALTNIVIKLN